MIDVRENILTRLVAIVATIPGIRFADRNNTDITEDQLPAAIVLDGDETTDDATDFSMKPPYRPTNVHMTPGILVIHQDPNVGSDLDVMRRDLIKAVMFDTALNDQIVKTYRGGNGQIRYLGCQVGVGYLRDLHGALQVQFLFKYVLDPNKL